MTILSVRRSNRIDAMNHRRSPRLAAASSSSMDFITPRCFTLVHTKQSPRSKPKSIKKKTKEAQFNDLVFKNLRTRRVVMREELAGGEKQQESDVTSCVCGIPRTATRDSRRSVRRSPRVRKDAFIWTTGGVRRSRRIALGA
mmetsp:Transcript_3002/g.3607  ORF Transcript_3002/g.3607 Transcript_3002/m.3607 type:complete len:142 (-) Transcript_3002:40-465(-)